MIEKYTLGDFQTNTYVLSKGNKCVIIDPSIGFERVINDIKSKYEIEGVIITHAHIDHIDGIRFLMDYPIYISRIDYLYLDDDGYTLYGWYSESLPFNKEDLDFHLLDHESRISILDGKIECFLTPGHTLGGMVFKYEDCIFTGDTLFNGSIGRTDFPGGNLDAIYKSIVFIIEEFDDNTRLFPGHDDATAIREERKNNIYYKDAKSRGR